MSEPPEAEAGLRRQLESLGGREVGGWKVGLTSGSSRDAMGVGFRPFGHVLAERVLESEAEIPLHQFDAVGVENELCFHIGATLGGKITRAEAAAAVEAVSPAFEINEPRLTGQASVVERLADNLSQWGIVVGQPVLLDWSTFDFSALEVCLRQNGEHVETVAAAGHIDDHFESIAALVRQLSRFDRVLAAGAKVITGAYTRQRVAEAGRWEGDFGDDIGRVGVVFT